MTAERPTPETDNEAFLLDDGVGEAVMSDFARELERQRDELLEALQSADAHIGVSLVGLAQMPERKLVMVIRHDIRSAITKIEAAKDSARMDAGFCAALKLTRKALKGAV